MRGNVIETVMGAVVLVVAAVFLFFAYSTSQLRAVQGYELTAEFERIDGIREFGHGKERRPTCVLLRPPTDSVTTIAKAREGEALPAPAPVPAEPAIDAVREMVWEVLVKQLGHRPTEASQLVADAFKRRPSIATAEELFDEIYRAAGARA